MSQYIEKNIIFECDLCSEPYIDTEYTILCSRVMDFRNARAAIKQEARLSVQQRTNFNIILDYL